MSAALTWPNASGHCSMPSRAQPRVWRSRRDGGGPRTILLVLAIELSRLLPPAVSLHRLLAWARALIRVDGFLVKVFPESSLVPVFGGDPLTSLGISGANLECI